MLPCGICGAREIIESLEDERVLLQMSGTLLDHRFLFVPWCPLFVIMC